MKILERSKKDPIRIKRYEKATKDCLVCPFCGETEIAKYLYIKKGIEVYESSNVIYGFGNSRKKKVQFTCATCGTKWESKPYRIN